MNEQMTWLIEVPWLLPALFWITGVAIGYAIHVWAGRVSKMTVEKVAAEILDTAKQKSGIIIRDAEVKAREELQGMRDRVGAEFQQHREQIAAHETRLALRDEQADARAKILHEKEMELTAKAGALAQGEEGVRAKQRESDGLIATQKSRLAEISGLSEDAARKTVLENARSEMMDETATLIRRSHESAIATAAQQARKIIVTAIERYAADQVADSTTTTVVLPGEEMKGRIIGRDGRNIRSLEAAFGVNVIIDDTPGVVVLSSFDPIRREVAKRALEMLVVDGRIHPARIEEVTNKVQAEMDGETQKAGEEAAQKLDVRGLDPEVVKMIGRLRFRHSYGQNVLMHSIEMGRIMGMMAAELGLDAAVAKRCGLLHDIGKVLPQEAGGSHALAGADFLRRHSESAIVCNAAAAHHNEVPGESWYAELTRAGDAITAARPGARSETTEIYLKRLENLEELARSFPGVTKCFAMEAGREIRVMVEPTKIDDHAALVLARDLSRLIEQNLEFPGQIRVVVIREMRCTEYAR